MKTKHGGKRQGSGRKQKYGEDTKVVSFRLPESIILNIKTYVKSKLKKYEHHTTR